MTERTETEAVAELALQSTVRPTALEVDRVHTVVRPSGWQTETIDLEAFGDAPRRKHGHVVLNDAESFAAYVIKHRVDDDLPPEGSVGGEPGVTRRVFATELYADVTTQRIEAILNDHATSTPGWGDHQATLRLATTKAWQRWIANDDKLMSQSEFAEHIEDSLPDIMEPDGATMLEIAQTFHAHTDVVFQSSKMLHSGQQQLQYVEQTQASAGETGTLEVPREIVLTLVPFEVGPPYKVTARIRFRLVSGRLQIGYKLDRPEDVLREAFKDVVEEVQSRTSMDVLYGTPPSHTQSPF